jgi:uncharacterized OB-fold protein
MPRPLPRLPEPDSEPFWRATKNHELKYQQCNDCNEVVFYPRQHCTKCGSASLTWKTSAGRGKVYTFSIIRQNRSSFFRDLVPYVLAYVDMDEGFRIMTNIVDIEPEKVRCDMPVKVQWEDYEEVALPLFAPA